MQAENGAGAECCPPNTRNNAKQNEGFATKERKKRKKKIQKCASRLKILRSSVKSADKERGRPDSLKPYLRAFCNLTNRVHRRAELNLSP